MFVFGVFHNVPHLALQNAAEGVDGVGADAFVAFQAGDLGGADVMFLNEGILRNSLFFHHVPQIIVRNHLPHLTSYLHINQNRCILLLTNIG